jgi:hypothetical protein
MTMIIVIRETATTRMLHNSSSSSSSGGGGGHYCCHLEMIVLDIIKDSKCNFRFTRDKSDGDHTTATML